jgi:hypothetical protein
LLLEELLLGGLFLVLGVIGVVFLDELIDGQGQGVLADARIS